MSVTGVREVCVNLVAHVEVVHVRVLAASHEIAALLQAYAKSHHPFQNQSGKTEQTTTCTVHETSGVIRIILSSKTPYAQYLELSRAGKWAWLRDAVTANKDQINHILESYLGMRGAFEGAYTVTAEDKRLHP